MKTTKTGSFRDPNGFVYKNNQKIFRQVNQTYFPQFSKLIESGLYKKLVSENYLIKHKLISKSNKRILLEHPKIPFITYPYEWAFDQLKDAALTTLKIQKIALDFNMTLKDASAYNVQFIGSCPIFIDTLSFDIYEEGNIWIAYKQFCQHFLSPLALMAEKDLRLNVMLRDFIDGIPLDLTSKLLPISSRFNYSLLSHIHLHAGSQKKMAGKKINKNKYKMSKSQMLSLIQSIESAVNKINIKEKQSEWNKYYTFTNYNSKAFKDKRRIVEKYLKSINPKSVLDLGGNTGIFSQIAVNRDIYTILCDSDPLAINAAYINAKKISSIKLLPISIDLTNPSSSIGWANNERQSFSERFKVNCVFALALIHHLAISNNLPFDMIASYFSNLGKYLIIEFVPKEDSKVQILLQNRDDIFATYSKEDFENAFGKYFKIIRIEKIKASKRIVYLMEKR